MMIPQKIKTVGQWAIIAFGFCMFSLVMFIQLMPDPKIMDEEAMLQEIGSPISFDLPLYIVGKRMPTENLKDNTPVEYGLSCYRDSQTSSELLPEDTSLTIMKVGSNQRCAPHGEGCSTDYFYIAQSQSGKLVEVTRHDVIYNLNNCKERDRDYIK